MRITIRIEDELFIEAKTLAVEANCTLGALIESALRNLIARRTPYELREPFVLPTYGSGGTLPGADLDDSAALLDIMEPVDETLDGSGLESGPH